MRALKVLLIILDVFLVLALVLIIGAIILIQSGKSKLKNKANSEGPDMVIEETVTNEQDNTPGYVWKEGWVRYNGDIYEYNEDILTFLVMGIDKKGVVKDSKTPTGGGQSDAMFLLIINPHNQTMNIFAIDRNTMAEINMVGAGENGMDATAVAQLAVQHGFGDGKELSCELTRDAITNFLFNLPIHGYISVNYEAIPAINDAVGGVEVTIPEDLVSMAKKAGINWKAGDRILLKGQDAIRFIKWRDTSLFESARLRTRRQKEYLTSFVAQAIEATKKDVTMPINLYNKIKGYTVTDISVDEMTYLASELINYRFSAEHIYSMEGETIMGEEFEEFYPDMDALKAQMIELFYEKVDIE